MGIASGVLVGRFNLSANASWLLNRAAISETIQEPLRKPTTPIRRRREQLAQRTQRNAAQAFGRVDLKEKKMLTMRATHPSNHYPKLFFRRPLLV